MSEKTKIQWADSTLNFWEGCTKVSDGCKHCYAEARDKRFTGGKLWGKGAPRRKSKSAVKQAMKLNREWSVCNECGGSVWNNGDCDCGAVGAGMGEHRRRIFSLSLGDWLDPEVPIEWLAEMLDTIRQRDQVTWILCTKRPELWRERMEAVAQWNENNAIGFADLDNWLNAWIEDEPPQNIILLTSVENQKAADERIPALLKIPAACRGLSLEPLLGEVKLPVVGDGHFDDVPIIEGINWLIIGGESGANARTCNVQWIRSLVQQGKDAGVATFVKQLGAKPIMPAKPNGTDGIALLADKKGADPAEWPDDLRFQEWPKGF